MLTKLLPAGPAVTSKVYLLVRLWIPNFTGWSGYDFQALPGSPGMTSRVLLAGPPMTSKVNGWFGYEFQSLLAGPDYDFQS